MENVALVKPEILYEEKKFDISLSLCELNHIIENLDRSLYERAKLCETARISVDFDSEYRALVSLLIQLLDKYEVVKVGASSDELPF